MRSLHYLRYSLLGFTCLVVILLTETSCDTSSSSTEGKGNFSVQGEFSSCQMDSIRIYMVDGLTMKPLLAAPIKKEGENATFSISGDLPQEGMYFIGQAPRNLRGILLGAEQGVRITGNCLNLAGYLKIENSPINQAFEEMNGRISQFYAESREVARQFVPTKVSDPNQEIFFRRGLNRIVEKQFAYLDSLKAEEPLLAKIFAINLQELFDPEDNPEGYSNEIDHLGGEMLAHADLSDPAYGYLPAHDAVRTFVPQLLNPNLPFTRAQTHIDKLLTRSPEGSQTHKNMLAAVINQMEQLSSEAYPAYAESYIQLYAPDDVLAQEMRKRAQIIQQLADQRAEAERITKIGATPPEIRLPDRSGNAFPWESLRGKIVLLDFWASWCGPCRKENPNVVRLYNQYKKQGFEILGVSLDNNKSQWLQAIEQDRLTWKHVSDLKGWRSQAAQAYSVSSIPRTFLLDRSGKIIGKNLRGRALEAKLAEIFAN